MRSLLLKILLLIAVESTVSTGIGIHADWDIQGKVGHLCENGVMLDEDYPPCDCLKKMPIMGNLALGPPDIPYFGDVPGFNDQQSVPNISSDNEMIIPSGSVLIDGLECIENGSNETVKLERTILYMLNIKITEHQYNSENSYIKFKDTSSGEFKMNFLKNITRKNSLNLISGELKINDESVQTFGPEDNLCRPFEDGMMKDIVGPILSLIMFERQSCPIKKGTSVVVKSNNPITLISDDPLQCGNYEMNVQINSLMEPDVFLELTLEWTVSENLHCGK
ncbi:uncharacterized protein LOC123270701 [Cotesia glomerata]|uniref:Uncharacterized protein n=1 Tax=Cotesia glomerata TaxID=32391 RepID=A0AAV7IIA5_COTGL|nr:uncharacterized protein LOC123270701 [Cotesia glomerata]KAH0552793.1 hypothetical protein KQX54_015348 [Cotesia glomerata]